MNETEMQTRGRDRVKRPTSSAIRILICAPVPQSSINQKLADVQMTK